jgi:hypothetical protein
MSRIVAVNILNALSNYGLDVTNESLWNEMVEKVQGVLESQSYQIISDDPDTVTVIRWCREDVAAALKKNGIEPTDEHIDVFAKHGADSLRDYSIEEGWAMMDAIIGNLQDDGKLSEGEVE